MWRQNFRRILDFDWDWTQSILLIFTLILRWWAKEFFLTRWVLNPVKNKDGIPTVSTSWHQQRAGPGAAAEDLPILRVRLFFCIFCVWYCSVTRRPLFIILLWSPSFKSCVSGEHFLRIIIDTTWWHSVGLAHHFSAVKFVYRLVDLPYFVDGYLLDAVFHGSQRLLRPAMRDLEYSIRQCRDCRVLNILSDDDSFSLRVMAVLFL